jgi:heme exporter protein A
VTAQGKAAVVDARGLFQSYGRQSALRGVDLALRPGEAVALLGPNGAGKSTLLRILSSLERPARGEVRWGGQAAGAEVRRSVGLVAHESLCYADLSARENLRFFGDLYDLADGPRRVEALLERVALVEAADRALRTYSRGMLQRIAVARALLPAPSLLLLDEPFTGLDRQGVALLGRLLADEKARGAAMLVVSHDLPAIVDLVDRVVVLLRGKIVRDEALPTARGVENLERVYDAAVPGLTSAAPSGEARRRGPA